MIVARTLKGKGRVVRRRQGRLARQGVQEGRRARSRPRRARDAVRARPADVDLAGADRRSRRRGRRRSAAAEADRRRRPTRLGEQVATREAYGTALAKLGEADARVVALDADVKNSTFSDKFEKALPGPLLSELHRRAGDGRVGDGAGGARRDSVPVDVRLLPDAAPPTSSAWRRSATSASSWPARTRACRSARTARRRWRSRISRCAGRSRTSPCCIRATRVSAERLVALAAYHPGPVYIRTSRPKTPVIYSSDETFAIGGLKVLRESANDVATVVGGWRHGVRGAEGLRSAEGRGHVRSA